MVCFCQQREDIIYSHFVAKTEAPQPQKLAQQQVREEKLDVGLSFDKNFQVEASNLTTW